MKTKTVRKVILNVDKSMNNYDYDKETMIKVIEDAKETLWQKYEIERDNMDEELMAIYNLLDMFRSYEISEGVR